MKKKKNDAMNLKVQDEIHLSGDSDEDKEEPEVDPAELERQRLEAEEAEK